MLGGLLPHLPAPFTCASSSPGLLAGAGGGHPCPAPLGAVPLHPGLRLVLLSPPPGVPGRRVQSGAGVQPGTGAVHHPQPPPLCSFPAPSLAPSSPRTQQQQAAHCSPLAGAQDGAARSERMRAATSPCLPPPPRGWTPTQTLLAPPSQPAIHPHPIFYACTPIWDPHLPISYPPNLLWPHSTANTSPGSVCVCVEGGGGFWRWKRKTRFCALGRKLGLLSPW